MTKARNIFLRTARNISGGRCDDIGSTFVGASVATRLLMDEAMKEHMELLDHNKSLLEGAVWLGKQSWRLLEYVYAMKSLGS